MTSPATSVALRNAGAADLSVLEDLYRRSSLSNDDDRAVLLEHPEALVLDRTAVVEGRTRVALVDGRIVGFATTLAGGEADELEDLFVDPAMMRRGIATALIADAVSIALARGARCIEVTANGHALAFYASVGFVATGHADTRFGPARRLRLDLAHEG